MNEIFLLVGGEATRLQPLSTGIPKALLTIRGEKSTDSIGMIMKCHQATISIYYLSKKN